MSLDDLHNNLAVARDAYVQGVREFVRVQRGSWRRVPWWCLQADGRSGYLSKWSTCYSKKVYQLTEALFVDCRTGELVGWSSSTDGFGFGSQPIEDNKWTAQLIMALELDNLRADKLLAQLQAHAKEPVSKVIQQQPPGWREVRAKEHGLCCAGC